MKLFRLVVLMVSCILMVHEAPVAVAATWIVTSRADGGTGSLRRAILSMIPGDAITVGTIIFPSTNFATIKLLRGK